MATETIIWTDGHGKEVSREINLTLNVEDFRGTPGYAQLVIAANRHLSIPTVERWLELVGVEVSRNWLYRRRWMFQDPKTVNKPGSKSDEDGKYARAVAIIRENRKMSVGRLSWLLRQHGITRCREWVRQHRCD